MTKSHFHKHAMNVFRAKTRITSGEAIDPAAGGNGHRRSDLAGAISVDDASWAGSKAQQNAKQQGKFGRIVGNFKWLSLSVGLTTVSTVVTNAVLARKMGASTFGEWAVITATTSWILVIRAGIGSHLTRLAAASERKATELLVPSLMLMTVWGLFLGAMGLATNVTLQSARILSSSLLAFSGTFVAALGYMIVSAFAGRDRMQWSLTDSAQAWILALLVICIPARFLNCAMVAGLFLISCAIPAIPCLGMGLHRLQPVCPPRMASVTWALARDNVWLIGIQLLVTFHLSIDLCLLRLFRDSVQVGFFAAALKVIIAVRLLPWLVMSSLIPELSRTSLRDSALASRVWTGAMKVLLPLDGIFILVCAFVPGGVLGLLYSHSYSSSSTALMILGASLIPHCLWQVLAASVMSAGHYKAHFMASLFGLAIHAAASLALISRYGSPGAAWAFGIGECAGLLGIAVAASRGIGSFSYSGLWRFGASLVVPVAAGAIAVAHRLPPSLACAGALACYALALFKLGIVSPAELGTYLRTGYQRG